MIAASARHRRALTIAALASAWLAARADAQIGGWFDGGVPTLGGMWVWSDEIVYDDWRIQANARNGHYRLIDPDNHRFASGALESCLARLDEIKIERKLPPLPEHVVIVVHGLGGNRLVMAGLCKHLREQGGLAVINFGYPSTMGNVHSYAASLDSVVRHLQGVKSISFVAHSMGNIVVRKYLRDLEILAPPMRPPVVFHRMVMIAPPNHGAEIADTLGNRAVLGELADYFAGEPAKELAPKQGWPALEPQLATPGFEFGIIAGGRGDDEGYLSAIAGDDDGMLSVATTRLAGATDSIRIDSIHQFMPQNAEVRTATLNFLAHGYFAGAYARRPIPANQIGAAPVAGAPSPVEAPMPTPVATR